MSASARRPATAVARPPPSRATDDDGAGGAGTARATGAHSARRPASAIAARPPSSAAPPFSALRRRSHYFTSTTTACSDSEEDDEADAQRSRASTRPYSSYSARSGSGSWSSRPLSARSVAHSGDVDSLLGELRGGQRYAEFIPPPSPFTVQLGATPQPAAQNAAVRALYRVVNGHDQRSNSSSRPSSSRSAASAAAHTAAAQSHGATRAHPDVPLLFQSTAATAAGLPPQHYNRPSMAHNFSDGSRKSNVSDSAHESATEAADAQRAAAHTNAQAAEPPRSRSPSRSRSPRRSGRSTRPSSSHRSSAGSPSGMSSRERDVLWTKWTSDAAEARAREEAEMGRTRALDQALHIVVPPKYLHEPHAPNHALQGMRLVSEDAIAALERAHSHSVAATVAAAAAAAGEASDEDEQLPDGAAEAMAAAAASSALSDADLPDDDGDGPLGIPRPLSSRAAQRELEDAQSDSGGNPRGASGEAHAIDFGRVGIEVARRLKAQGHPLSSHHLDVMHSLPLLERVWLAASSSVGSRGRGLSEGQFVDFLSAASHINKPTLAVLFDKIDINDSGQLGWDAFLSYLVRELSHKWRMSAGAGTYVLVQDSGEHGSVRSDTATAVVQLLLLEEQGNPLYPTYTSKIVARCRNHTLQAFDTRTLKYLYHVPLHATLKKKKNAQAAAWADAARHGADERDEQEARDRGAGTAGDDVPIGARASASTAVSASASPVHSRGPSSEQKVPLYSAAAAFVPPLSLGGLPKPKINANHEWASSSRAEVLAMHAEAAERREREQRLAREEAERRAEAAELAEGDTTTTPRPSSRSSIARIGKSKPGTPRPFSARPPSAQGGGAASSRPLSARMTPRPPSASVSHASGKVRQQSNYDRKLEAYLREIDAAAAVPVAQPLACVGQHRYDGRPPQAERRAPGSSGGVLHRHMVELAQRNKPYTFPLTALASYAHEKQIVVAAQDRSVRFFGLVRRQFELQNSFFVHEPPQSLIVETVSARDHSSMHGQADRHVAIVGSLGGAISCYNPATHARLCTVPGVHGDQSVVRLALLPHVGLVSAGMDGRLAITDPASWRVGRYLGSGVGGGGVGSRSGGNARDTSRGHSGGIVSFAFASGTRTLLSGGYDRAVLAWDPLVAHPVWRLPPQTGDLLEVLVNEAKNQVVVVLRDAKVRVYDSRNFKVVAESMDQRDAALSAACFDTQRQHLLTASDRITHWRVEPSVHNKVALAEVGPPAQPQRDHSGAMVSAGTVATTSASPKAHISSIIGVLYSAAFQQVITVCENESVRVWDLYGGCAAPHFEFQTSHRAQLTAAALDSNGGGGGGKRLLTSCHHGRIMMWNPNNGELLWEFAHYGGGRVEINRLTLLSTASQCLVGTGWSNNVLRWPAPNSLGSGLAATAAAAASVAPSPAGGSATGVTESVGHSAQILSLASFANLIVTADARGEIISWAADSGHRLHSLVLPATSRELRVHRPSASGGAATAAAGTQPLERAACSPAVTTLNFFLLHDLEGYDAWHHTGSKGTDASGDDLASSVHLGSAPADYRTQLSHAHRACLFVGTDDGSVHLVSPQGLALLHSAVHLMADTIVALAVVQRVREEEVHDPAREAAERRAAVAAAAAAAVAGRRGSVAHRLSVASEEAFKGAPSPSSDTSGHLKLPGSSNSGNNSNSSGGGAPVRSHSRNPSFSGSAPISARVRNPFQGQKKAHFAKVVKKAADDASDPAAPADDGDEPEGDTLQSVENEFAAAVAELASLEPDQQQQGGASTKVRRPFTTKIGVGFGFKPSPHARASGWLAPQQPPEPASLEEYLAQKKAKKAAEEKAALASKPKQTQARKREEKEQPPATSAAATAPSGTFLTEAPLEPRPAGADPVGDLVIRVPVPAPKQYRRVIETRMLVADGMAGNDAVLFDICMSGSGSSSMYRASALVELQWELRPLRSMYLHAPPAATAAAPPSSSSSPSSSALLQRPVHEDATSDVSLISEPRLGVQLFVAASMGGRATLWDLDGDFVAEFGQARARGWPVRKPAGSALEHVHEQAPLSQEWTGAANANSGFPDAGAASAADDSGNSASMGASTVPDAWSSDSDEDLTPEQERSLLSMQASALGFDADDSSVNAMLASLRKKKFMNSEDARRGMAMGPAFASYFAQQKAAAAALAAAAGQSQNSTSPTNAAALTRPPSAAQRAREERRRAKQRRLLDSLKQKYASSFHLMQSRPRNGGGGGGTNDAGDDAAVLPQDAASALIVGGTVAKSFAEAHPPYIPETLRPGGLRSALFLNDAKLRMGKTHEQIKAALKQREAAARRMRQHSVDSNAPGAAGSDDRAAGHDLNFFQLGPREQAEAAQEQARRDQSIHALTRFLSNRSNVFDEETGAVRDHAVARLAVLLDQQDATARRMADRQNKDQRPTHVRAASRTAKIINTNVFVRLSVPTPPPPPPPPPPSQLQSQLQRPSSSASARSSHSHR